MYERFALTALFGVAVILWSKVKRRRVLAIGHSYDIHRINRSEEQKNAMGMKYLKLGGVQISDEFQVEAHSDGDCLLHAIADAILGALGFDDIGQVFPDRSEEWKNVDSCKILERVLLMGEQFDMEIVSVDCTVILEAVKVSLFKQEIKRKLRNLLECNQVNVKARTSEGLDSIGMNKAVACHAVVLLSRTQPKKSN
jgi:2-C-methyl-D-erythritol 2,4-cyclodiphosphate synthase